MTREGLGASEFLLSTTKGSTESAGSEQVGSQQAHRLTGSSFPSFHGGKWAQRGSEPPKSLQASPTRVWFTSCPP